MLYRGRGRPINRHTKPKRTEQIYLETLEQAIFMKRPGESIADVISRVFTVYSSRSEESEYYEQMKLLDEEYKRKENRIKQLEEENKKLKQSISSYISTQINPNTLS